MSWLPRRMVRRALALLVVAAGAPLGVAAVPAAAGQFSVYSCQTPAGHAVLTPGSEYGKGWGFSVADNCANASARVTITLDEQQQAVGNYSRMRVELPDGMTLAKAEIRRSVTINPGSGADVEAEPQYTLYRDFVDETQGRVLERCSFVNTGCTQIPDAAKVWDFSANPVQDLWFDVRCVSTTGGTSGTCAGSSSAYRAQFRSSAMWFLVNENTRPTGSVTGTAIDNERVHTGTEDAVVRGIDTGSGFYQAYATINGVAAGRATVGGQCADQGNNPTTDLDFESFQPCPLAPTALALPVNMRAVENGPRQVLRIWARDAAGNETKLLERAITIDNPPLPTPTPAPTATPAPTVPPLAPAPTPTPTPPARVVLGSGREGRVVLDGTSPVATVQAARKSVRVTGRLVAPAGTPLAGEPVLVFEQVSIAGATWSQVDRLTTDAEGAFSYAPRTNASRSLRFDYTFGDGTTSSQTFAVKVQAPISIRPGRLTVRAGGTVRLSGMVTLAYLPAKGATLDIQVLSRGRWQSIDRASVSRAGRWAWKYKLGRSTHPSYRFRAFLRAAADVPAEPSASGVVAVRVRR